MDDLRERIYEVVGSLKSQRGKELAADMLQAVLEAAADHKGRVLVSLRADPHQHWSFEGGTVRRVERGGKAEKTPVLIDASVDPERLESALGKVHSVQQLAFQSGMRISGTSAFIVAASDAINRRCFPRLATRGVSNG